MVGKEHPISRENRILNIRAVSAPPEHNTQRRMNMIAKTILEQIGGRRFAAMTGSKDFIDMGNGLRMSLARNKTSANRLDIIYDEGGRPLQICVFYPQKEPVFQGQKKKEPPFFEDAMGNGKAANGNDETARGDILRYAGGNVHDGDGALHPFLRGGRRKPPTFFQ